MAGHSGRWQVLTCRGFHVSPFRINLPIQTFSALNFRGEFMSEAGVAGGRNPARALPKAGQEGNMEPWGQSWGLGTRNGAAAGMGEEV